MTRVAPVHGHGREVIMLFRRRFACLGLLAVRLSFGDRFEESPPQGSVDGCAAGQSAPVHQRRSASGVQSGQAPISAGRRPLPANRQPTRSEDSAKG